MKKSYTLLLLIAAIFILACLGSVSAEDPQNNTIENDTSSSPVSEGLPEGGTTNIYVNVNTGNDAWDGSSPTHVDGTVIGPKQHISKGITSSFSGGNLYIANGTYKECGLTVDRNLNIFGSSITGTIVDAQGNGIVFKINANIKVTIQHLSMTNGWGQGTVSNEDGDNGGGVYNLGTLTLTDCNIYNNHAGNGQDGTAGHGAGKGGNGGGVYNSGTLTIINCDIHNNYSGNGGDASATRHGDHGGFGAGIYNSGTLTIQDSKIHDNTAGNGGTHSGIYSGSYGGYGGGIYNTNILNMTNCEIYNNKAGNGASNVVEADAQHGGYGGGMYNTGTANLSNVNIHDNLAGTGGTVVNVDGHGGEGGYGGAIYNTGNLTITGTNTIITNNAAGTGGKSNVLDESAGNGGKGGAIFNTGTCKITSATISNNKGGAGGEPYTLDSNGGDGGNGGAFYNEAAATMTLDGCTINNNQAGNGHSGVTNDKYLNFGGGEGGDGGSGGAVFNFGTITINNCNITGNKAGNGGTGGQSTLMFNGRIGGRGGDGGGIYNGSAAILTITGSTIISSNSAGNGGQGGLGRCIFDADLDQVYYNPGNGGNGGNGGGIYNIGTINPLTNITIQNNTAGTGGAGGVYEVDNTLYDPGEKTPAIPGIGGNGGGIYNAGILTTLQNVIMTGNAAGTGGSGSPCSDSEPENGNTGGNGGALYILNQPININNCIISDNHAGDGGAGSDMYVGTHMDPAKRIPGKGGTGGSGGAIYVVTSNLNLHININNTTFNNNSAGNGGMAGRWSSGNPPIGVGGNGGYGGAIAISSMFDHKLFLQILESTFTNNKAGLGFIAPQGSNGADGVGGAFYSNINQNFTVNFNRIVDNTPQAVYLNLIASDTNINFQNNWWGTNNYNNELLLQFMGTHISSMNYTPYLILSINANPTVLNNTLNSNITTNLIMNNVGQNTLTMYGKYVPDNIPVLFTSNLGTLNPVNGVTLNGSSNSIFTATISGSGKVCSTVDHQTVCTQIQVSDLILKKTGEYVPYCSEILWRIYAQNLSSNALNNLVVNDLITPASLTEYWTYYVSYTGGKSWVQDGTYNPTTGNWTISNLPAGTTYILALYTTPENGIGKIYNNTATCNYNGTPIKTDGTIYIQDNNVSMTKSGIYSNNQIIWTIGVVNNGNDTANFTVWDLMGSDCPNTEYLNYHVSYNNGAIWVKDGTYDPVTGEWVITGLDKGETFLLKIYATATNGMGKTYNNTATNSFDETATASVYIPQASLTLTPTVQSTVYLNQNFTAFIKLENKGPDTAQDVIIDIPIPLAFQLIDASMDQGTWSYDQSTRILTLNIGDVPVGDLELRLTLKPTILGQYILNHLLTTVTYDPNNGQQTPLTIRVLESENPNTNPTETVDGQTIPMQNTGTPFAALFLALVAIIGGTAYHRLR